MPTSFCANGSVIIAFVLLLFSCSGPECPCLEIGLEAPSGTSEKEIQQCVSVIEKRLGGMDISKNDYEITIEENAVNVKFYNSEDIHVEKIKGVLGVQGKIDVHDVYTAHELFPLLNDINTLEAMRKSYGNSEGSVMFYAPSRSSNYIRMDLLPVTKHADAFFKWFKVAHEVEEREMVMSGGAKMKYWILEKSPQLGTLPVSKIKSLDSIFELPLFKKQLPENLKLCYTVYPGEKTATVASIRTRHDGRAFIPYTHITAIKLIPPDESEVYPRTDDLQLTFDAEGSKWLKQLSEKHKDKHIAVLIDGQPKAYPLMYQVFDQGVFNFTALQQSPEFQYVALAVQGGIYPIKITVKSAGWVDE